MNRHDEVFSMFVQANPVAIVERDDDAVPEFDSFLDHLRSAPRPQPVAAVVVRRRWAAAVAAFAVVIAIIGGAVVVFRGANPAEPVARPSTTAITPSTTLQPATTTAPTTVTSSSVAPENLEPVAQEAVDTALRLLAAVVAGDIDTVMALSAPDASSIADRRTHEFLAAFSAAGATLAIGECEAQSVTQETALVRCAVTLGDAVTAELGPPDVIYPFRYRDGLLSWQPFEGVDIGEVNRAYADYLRAYLPDAYAASCSPGAYNPLDIIQSNLLALTGECGQLAASVAEEVAAWIRDGRPDPPD